MRSICGLGGDGASETVRRRRRFSGLRRITDVAIRSVSSGEDGEAVSPFLRVFWRIAPLGDGHPKDGRLGLFGFRAP